MTPADIDALTAPALSEAVAREVCGWQLIRHDNFRGWFVNEELYRRYVDANFAESLDACIEHVAPVLAARNIVVRMELLPSGESVCWVNNNSGGNISRDSKPATAFCRAALKAVGAGQ